MAELSKELKEKVEAKIEEAMSSFDPKNIENVIDILKSGWDLLPEPKNEWSDSFLIAKYITHVYFNAQQYKKSLEWAEIFVQTDPGRDYGESEFMLGKVLFKLGDKEKARKNFIIADEKSDGRVWKGENDMTYFKFFKSKE